MNHPPSAFAPSATASATLPKPQAASTESNIPEAQIVEPRENDVLFGRGNGAGLHKGNIYFRTVIERYAPDYERTSNNMAKNQIASSVRAEIEMLQPPGRFLQGKNRAYVLTTNDKTILEKIKQALRDRLKVNRNSQTPTNTSTPYFARTDGVPPIPREASFRTSSTNSEKALLQTLMLSNESLKSSPPKSRRMLKRSSFVVSKRTLDCISHAFASKEDVQYPSVDSVHSINQKQMPARFDRMFMKNSIDTAAMNTVRNKDLKSSIDTADTVPMSNRQLNSNPKNFDVSMNDLSFMEESLVDTSMNSSVGNIAQAPFQMEDMLPQQCYILPDVVIGQQQFSVDDTPMVDSLFSLEQFTSGYDMDL